MKWLCNIWHPWNEFTSPVKVLNYKGEHITNKYYHFRECKRCDLLQQSSCPESSILFTGWKTIDKIPEQVSIVKTRR